MPQFNIPGVDPNYLQPRWIAQIVFGAGAITTAAAAMSVCCVGMKISAGSMTADQDILQVFTASDCDAAAGAGSELAIMGQTALGAGGGNTSVPLYLAAPANPGGPTAATITVVLGGAVTSPGQWAIRLAGRTYTGAIGMSDTNDTVGAAIASAMSQNTRLPFTFAYNAGTHTLTATCVQSGLQGNDWIFWFDPTNFLTTGLTATVTGSAQVNSNAYRVRAGATPGAGAPNVTNITAKMQAQTFTRVACAQYDTGTNAALWTSYVDTKAGPLVLRLEQLHFGFNGTASSGKTLAKTTLNDVRCTVGWARNHDWHPAMIAAGLAALRASLEGANPLPFYDGMAIPGMPGLPSNFLAVDNPSDAEQNDGLQNGLTVLATQGTQTVIVRGITTHCTTVTGGSIYDRRTIDWGDVTVVDRFTIDLGARWYSWRQANPYVQDDWPQGAQAPQSGIATPTAWKGEVLDQMHTYAANADGSGKGWILPYTANDVTAYFDPNQVAIASMANITPSRLQHQLLQRVQQARSA